MALCASGGGFSLTPEQLDDAAATDRLQRALPPRYRTGYYIASGERGEVYRHVKRTEYPVTERRTAPHADDCVDPCCRGECRWRPCTAEDSREARERDAQGREEDLRWEEEARRTGWRAKL